MAFKTVIPAFIPIVKKVVMLHRVYDDKTQFTFIITYYDLRLLTRVLKAVTELRDAYEKMIAEFRELLKKLDSSVETLQNLMAKRNQIL